MEDEPEREESSGRGTVGVIQILIHDRAGLLLENSWRIRGNKCQLTRGVPGGTIFPTAIPAEHRTRERARFYDHLHVEKIP